MKVYKVWLQVEMIDEDDGVFENVGEPTSLGAFKSLKKAEKLFNKIESEYYDSALETYRETYRDAYNNEQ